MSNELRNDLLKTNINVEPVAVMFNLSSSVVEEAIYKYFQKAGINGVAAVRISARKTGNNPELLVYAFFNKNSDDVISNMANVPDHLRNKMGAAAYRPSEKLGKALHGVCKHNNLAIHQGFVYARLDIFRCLALVLDCDPRTHNVIINEVAQFKKDSNCIISAIKALRYTGGAAPSTDKYARLIDSLER